MNMTDNQLHTLLRAAGLAALGVTGLVVGVRVYRRLKASSEQRSLEEAVKKLTTNDTEVKQTISDDTARLLATSLFEAFNVWNGTDTDVIRTIIAKLHNGKDWLAVIRAFGVRPYGTTGTPWFGDGTQLDLVGWFRKELSGSLMQEIENALDKYGIVI